MGAVKEKIDAESRFCLFFNTLGQLTIPIAIRKKLHLKAKSMVIAELEDGIIKIIPAEITPRARTLKDKIALQKELAKSYHRGPTGKKVSVSQVLKEVEE